MNETREKPMYKIQVYLDADTLKKFKAHCALQGQSMTQVIGEYIKKLLKQG